MTYFTHQLAKIRTALAIMLAIAAPFHGFAATWLKNSLQTELPLPLLAWRELLAGLIVLFCGIELILKKERLRFDVLDAFMGLYALLALAFLFFQRSNPAQWLAGMRLDVLPFVFFAAVRRAQWGSARTLIYTALASGAVVVLFGTAQTLFLPQDFLTRFGYGDYQGVFDPSLGLQSCQYLEHTNKLCRAVSTFGGPARYGAYLLVILGLLYSFLKNSRLHAFAVAFIAFAVSNVFFTYSRAFWIGLAAMAVSALFVYFKDKKSRRPALLQKKPARGRIIMLAVVLLALAGFAYIKIGAKTVSVDSAPFLKTIFARQSSTSEHWNLMRQGALQAAAHPFGIGLGRSGAASARFKKSLTENWYLQIAVEMGAIGLILFLGILILLLKKLAGRGGALGKGLFFALLGIAAAGMFTHSFEETSAVLLLMLFAGISLSLWNL